MPTIVVFDGVCTLCNTAVDFLLRNDATGTLRFVSFQDVKGAELLREYGVTTAPETIYVVTAQKQLLEESNAVLYVARFLQFPWRLLRVFVIIPKPLRNLAYRWIARNRYRWFGKKSSCRIPTAEERSRFL